LLVHVRVYSNKVFSSGGFALRRPIALAAVAILGLVPFGSLTAQPLMPYPAPYYPGYPGAYGDVPPHEVLAIVRSKGLAPLGRPRRQGTAYALRALDPSDREVQVTVDARTGRILRVVAVPGADAMAPPNPIPPGPMAPEENASNSRVAPYPNPAEERTRALPPLPRPRPKTAGTPSFSASAADPVPVTADPAPHVFDFEE
jgi:hypothetical protein